MPVSEAIRIELVRALQADLIGPFFPEDHPGAGEEVFPLAPSRWYLTGFPAPQSGRLPDVDDLVLVERRKSEDPSTWFGPADWPTGQPPGMIPLWRMIGDRRAADAPSANAICDELIRAFEVGIPNLHLIHELEYYFASPEEGDGRLYVGGLDEGRRLAARARDALWGLLVTEFSGKPDALVAALQNSPPWTLARVVWGSLRIHRKELSGKPFARWDELAPTVLAACAASPAIMLPQLAALVTQERGTQHDGRVTIYEFDVTRTRELFGNEKEVLRLFREPCAVDSGAEGMVGAVASASASINWGSEVVQEDVG